MTVSARNPYGKANKDKKYFGYISTGYSVYRAARRVRWGRWGEKRGVGAGKGRPEEMLAEMFMLLDEDHDGVIDIDELRDDMETVLKGEIRTPEELMAETDTNGDGNIDFDEFVECIQSGSP